MARMVRGLAAPQESVLWPGTTYRLIDSLDRATAGLLVIAGIGAAVLSWLAVGALRGSWRSAESTDSARIRRARRTTFSATALILALLSTTGVAAEIAGQKPLLTVSGSFSFKDRTWARYTVEPAAPAGHYGLWIATFSAAPMAGRPRW